MQVATKAPSAVAQKLALSRDPKRRPLSQPQKHEATRIPERTRMRSETSQRRDDIDVSRAVFMGKIRELVAPAGRRCCGRKILGVPGLTLLCPRNGSHAGSSDAKAGDNYL
jgi:hypothetical protein